MTIEADEIPVIVALFEDSDWEDLEITSGEIHLRLSKRAWGGSAPPDPPAVPAMVGPNVAPSVAPNVAPNVAPVRRATGGPGGQSPPGAKGTTAVPPPPAPPVEEEPPEGVLGVRSPTLGTFFAAPKPGAPPFVQRGDRVSADETLGIVEVMKLMNPIKAPSAGEVVKVCAANNELVEYDRVLFWIRPEGS